MGWVENRRRTLMEAAWTAARRRGVVTYAELSAEMRVGYRTAVSWVRAWEAAGIVERQAGQGGKRARFRVTAEALPERLRAEAGPQRRETAEGNMWRAMRGLKTFQPRDIAVHATTDACGVDEQAAEGYCRVLSRAGYLRAQQPTPKSRRAPIYRLIRDTGPRPPRECRVRAVYDDNLDDYTHIAGAA